MYRSIRAPTIIAALCAAVPSAAATPPAKGPGPMSEVQPAKAAQKDPDAATPHRERERERVQPLHWVTSTVTLGLSSRFGKSAALGAVGPGYEMSLGHIGFHSSLSVGPTLNGDDWGLFARGAAVVKIYTNARGDVRPYVGGGASATLVGIAGADAMTFGLNGTFVSGVTVLLDDRSRAYTLGGYADIPTPVGTHPRTFPVLGVHATVNFVSPKTRDKQVIRTVVPDFTPPPPPPPPPEPPERTYEITECQIAVDDAILFDPGLHEPLPASRPIITKIATTLLEHDEVTAVRVVGHTDTVGTDEDNLALSTRRVSRVIELLKDAGVPQRLEPDGRGESDPIYPVDDDPWERAQNRRVEFMIIGGPEECVDNASGT